jgi:dinuclear metal center YbgI/SA1388 family protein
MAPILSEIVDVADRWLGTVSTPDYPAAYNGLQLASSAESIQRIAAAVDASEHVIHDAIAQSADLLIVHHGLFWGGAAPLTGVRYRKIKAAMDHGLAVYSSHLPLDGHPEMGNGHLLAQALGLKVDASFGAFQGFPIGCGGSVSSMSLEEFSRRVTDAVGRSPHVIASGPRDVARVAVVTGAGGSFLAEASAEGYDTLVTGEGAHHTFAEAHELGVNLVYAGHYATETFGVRALADRLAAHFGIESVFLDHPSNL